MMASEAVMGRTGDHGVWRSLVMKPINQFRSAHLLCYLAILREFGVPVEPGLARARLPLALGDNPHLRLPVRPALAFVTETARAEGIDEFGFRAARRMQLAEFNAVLLRALSAAPTLKLGLEAVCRYAAYESNATRVWMSAGPTQVRFCSQFLPACTPEERRHAEWHANFLGIRTVQAFVAPHWRPTEMAFRSNLAIGPTARAGFPNTRFLVGQRASWIAIPRAVLSRGLASHCVGTSAPADGAGGLPFSRDLPQTLETALAAYLPDGYPDIRLAADIAGTSPRTLQRRLAECGVRYADLVQRARFNAAVEVLRKPGAKIIDAALAAGFDDASNFARAFRRIAGVSPRAYRLQAEARGASDYVAAATAPV